MRPAGAHGAHRESAPSAVVAKRTGGPPLTCSFHRYDISFVNTVTARASDAGYIARVDTKWRQRLINIGINIWGLDDFARRLNAPHHLIERWLNGLETIPDGKVVVLIDALDAFDALGAVG